MNTYKKPAPTSTGTTICGCVFKDGVVLGADTRATAGSIVANKNCEKIHYMAKNIYCCGAGTAADTMYVTEMISNDLELHRLEVDIDNYVVPVEMAKTLLKRYLYSYQGHVSAALILGGYDDAPYLCSVAPHGSTDMCPYVTMGSGSLAAMSVFESRYKPNMDEEQAKKMVRDAIAAGVFNDLGSGSNIDLCVIKKDKVDFLRGYEIANIKGVKSGDYRYPIGTTSVKAIRRFPVEIVAETVERVEPMEE